MSGTWINGTFAVVAAAVSLALHFLRPASHSTLDIAVASTLFFAAAAVASRAGDDLRLDLRRIEEKLDRLEAALGRIVEGENRPAGADSEESSAGGVLP